MLSKILVGSRTVVPTTVVTYSTPGSYTWTAPAGVTNILRLTGRGGSGGSQWENRGNYGAVIQTSQDCTSSVYGTSLNYSVPYNQGLAAVNRINTITTSSGGQFIDPSVSGIRIYIYSWCTTTSNWRVSSISGTGSNTFRRVGTATLTNTTPTSGTVPAPTSTRVEYVNTFGSLQQLNDFAGGGTSGFNNLTYSFSPGYGSSAPAASTFNNIAIVPGTSYNITVGTNLGAAQSFVQIEY